jgi:hypothetical protein
MNTFERPLNTVELVNTVNNWDSATSLLMLMRIEGGEKVLRNEVAG